MSTEFGPDGRIRIDGRELVVIHEIEAIEEALHALVDRFDAAAGRDNSHARVRASEALKLACLALDDLIVVKG